MTLIDEGLRRTAPERLQALDNILQTIQELRRNCERAWSARVLLAGDIVRLLSAADVEFILIGGLAAAVHGSPRVTQEIDIVYRRSDQNLARVVNALAPYHPYLRGAPRGWPFRRMSRPLSADAILL